MQTFFKYPSIENFQNFIKTYKQKRSFVGLDENNKPIFHNETLPPVQINGTIKLHGTNAGVTIFPDGEVYIQTRSDSMPLSISKGSSHFGFMQFVFDNSDWFQNSYESAKLLTDVENPIITFFGEWAGPGIQKNVGISGIPDKKFFIFGIQEQTIGEWIKINQIPYNEFNERIWYMPMFKTYSLNADFNDAATLLEQLNTFTLEVEKECPVAKEFGVTGIGEGIVWSGTDDNGNYIQFKVKGDEHQKKSREPREKRNDEKSENENINKFIDQVDIINRLQQCYHTLFENVVPSKKETAKVLLWVFNDIITEEYHLMQELELQVDEVKANLMTSIRLQFFEDIDNSL